MTKRWILGGAGAIFVLISAFAAWLPMQFMGMIDNGDWHMHWFRLHGFSQSLIEGVWRPYWHADANSGYGAPTFLFYPPLSYYMASLPVLLGFSINSSWSLTYLATLLVAAFGSYRLFRLWSSATFSAFAAALFVLSPPVLFNIYQTHMTSSALALAITPWLLWAVLNDGHVWAKKVLLVAVFSGLLILAHPMMAMPAAVVLAMLSIYLVARGDLHTVLLALVGGVLGLILSAWYWLPVILFRDLVQWEFLLNPAWQWENNVLFGRPEPPDGAFHEYRTLFDSLALAAVVLSIVLYSVIWSRSKESKAIATTLFILVLVCLYIMSPAGIWLADFIPPMGYLMFAWRWLGLEWLLMFGLLAVALQTASGGLAPSGGSSNQIVTSLQVAALAGMLVISMAVMGTGPLSDKMGLQSDRISRERATTAARTEIWPTLEMRPKTMGSNWNLDLKQDPMPTVWVRSGNIRVRAISRVQHEISINYEATRPSRVRLRHLNFPSWTARVDDERVPIKTEQGSGAMILSLPPGSRNVVIEYEGLPWASSTSD